MPFIGVIADKGTEKYITNNLMKNLNEKYKIIQINEKNIENLKNVKFDTIIIARKFKEMIQIKNIFKKVKYVIVNSDIEENLKILEGIETTIITYGFNSKATITASSVAEDNKLICLQRSIKTEDNKKIEAQEIKVHTDEDINNVMPVVTVLIIYKKT